MKEDFQRWWNEKYFYTNNPIYLILKKLYGLGADFRYIDFLCGWLEMGDLLQQRSEQYFKQVIIPKQKPHPLVSALSKHEKYFATLFQTYGSFVVLFTLEKLKLHLAAVADSDEKLDIVSQWLAEVSPRVLHEAKRIARDGWFGMIIGTTKHQKNKEGVNEKRQQETQGNHKLDLTELPISEVLIEYNAPRLPKRGNKADPWGSFFLLAVTEHMRENTKHPHFGAAIGLLSKVRKASRKSAHRETATVRVQQLKKSHSNWRYHLTLVKKQFAIQLAKMAANQSGSLKEIN